MKNWENGGPGFPEKSEYASYYAGYISRVDHSDIIRYLSGQLDGGLTFMRNIPAEKWNYRYSKNKWSVAEVIQHVIDAERVFNYRALCFARGETKALPGFDQNEYAQASEAHRRTPDSIIEEYRTVRKATLSFFTSLSPEAWLRTGNANGNDMSVRAIAFIIGGHQAHHEEVLRERYL